MRRSSPALLTCLSHIAACMLAALVAGCGGSSESEVPVGGGGGPSSVVLTRPAAASDGEAVSGLLWGSVVRVPLLRGEEDVSAPAVERAGHLDPADGVASWEVEAADWGFEYDDTGGRPLKMTGPGPRRVLIPGPLELEGFDRVTVMLTNPVHGTIRLTLMIEGGEQLRAEAKALKGRVKHPVTFKLPRSVRADEIVASLSLDLDLKRAVAIHAIDFIRQPTLATLPSPESGADLVNVGREARRGVGLGSEGTLNATWQSFEGDAATVWVVGALADGAAIDKGAEVSVTLERLVTSPSEGLGEDLSENRGPNEAVRTKSLPIPLNWTPLHFPRLAPGTYSARITLESTQPKTVVIVSELLVTRPPATEPKTVLLVTSDTHRADHLGATNKDRKRVVETPSLDALAASGVLFESAWTTSNTTIPSHSALLTGRHPRDTKVLGNYSSLGADPEVGPRTLAEVFSNEGYLTVAILSSSHLAHEYSGLGRGFDIVIRPGASEARAEDSLAAAMQLLDGGAPMFVWLHLFDAHGPYLPPADFDRRYYPKDKNPFDPALQEIDLAGGRMPLWLRGLRDHAYPRAQYRAEIAYLDSAIGELLSLPRVAKGITAFTSDHGEVFARRGVFYEHKGLTPDTLSVPLILRAPGIGGEALRVTDPVRQMDIGRTLLNLAGLGAKEFPGADLMTTGERAEEPRYAVSRRFASVTHGRWHGILTLSDLSKSKDGHWAARHQIELYDFVADPGCMDDRASEEIVDATRYRQAIIDWLGAADPTLRASRPNLDRAARLNLAALGYAAGAESEETSLFDPDCMCNECLKFK